MTPIDNLQERLAETGPVIFAVRAIPHALRNELVGVLGNRSVKVRIAAALERGKAGEELRSFLAGLFRVPNRNVTIVSGAGSRNKRASVPRV